MKKSFVGYILVFMLTCLAFLPGCIFDGTSKTISASGKIYFDSSPLEDVLLRTSTKILTQTNQNGEFEFNVKATSITVYPEKVGYTFLPNSITLSQAQNNLIFVAQKVEQLDGALSLAQIVITPTSISSFGDNFSYTQDGQSYLKISKFKMEVNGKTINPINSNYLATKNQSNTITVYDDITINTGVEFAIKFSLDAYFKMSNTEYVYVEEKSSVLEVKEKQYSNNLNSNNQIEYTVVGINSSNNKFTYNVTFVFNYYKNV